MVTATEMASTPFDSLCQTASGVEQPHNLVNRVCAVARPLEGGGSLFIILISNFTLFIFALIAFHLVSTCAELLVNYGPKIVIYQTVIQLREFI